MFFTTRDVTKYGLLCLLVIFFTTRHAHADGREMRGRDSLSTPSLTFSYKQLIVPATLMLHGVIETACASKVRLLNYAIGHKVIKHQPDKFQIDDISQYVPAASVYALNLAGVKGRNGFKERTIVLGMSAVFMAATVNLLKYTTRVKRPDKSTRNSFPSGHTAVAFMGAEFLWQEYKDVSIWYGIGGYTVAIGTGIFRMYNNRHWFGDVAFGAGVGILSTKLAYWIYPAVKQKFSRRHDNDKHVTLCPYYNGRQGGLSLSIQL